VGYGAGGGLEHRGGDVGVDLGGHACVGVAGELLGDPLVQTLLGGHRHVRVAQVMDATVLDAGATRDAVPWPSRFRIG
jgi:hypothetical protein